MTADGTFEPGFDPMDFSPDYAEANALQTLWGPIHDVDGLAALMGDDSVLVSRLDELFENARVELEENPLEVIQSNFGPRPYYWHGNEPDIHAAYFFGQVGRDDLTQRWLRWIIDELYSDRPDGLPGNDDGGTMGAWYVFSAMGIYPVAGTPTYFLGMPLFSKITVRTPDGKELVIEAPGHDSKTRGVSGVSINGAGLDRAVIDHEDLLGGSTIRFTPVDEPTAWSAP